MKINQPAWGTRNRAHREAILGGIRSKNLVSRVSFYNFRNVNYKSKKNPYFDLEEIKCSAFVYFFLFIVWFVFNLGQYFLFADIFFQCSDHLVSLTSPLRTLSTTTTHDKNISLSMYLSLSPFLSFFLYISLSLFHFKP